MTADWKVPAMTDPIPFVAPDSERSAASDAPRKPRSAEKLGLDLTDDTKDTRSWMRNAEHLIAPVCATCGREVDQVNGEWWHTLDQAPDDLSALDGHRG